MVVSFKKYEQYKPSGVAWLGEVPKHWELIKFKYIFAEINERSNDGNEELLSVSQYTGVTLKKDKVEEGGLLTNAETLEGYKKVCVNDLVSNIMLAWNGSLGFSPYNGITSPAYSVYRLKGINIPQYFHYLLRTETYKSEFKRNSSGVIESRLRLYSDDFFRIISLQPPLNEQIAIAQYLDRKTAQIDAAIAQKQQMIVLLKERRQILIHRAVTQGLDPSVKMKDSGVEWIGVVPEHWEVKRLKYLLDERTDRSKTGEETILMVSQVHGLVVRADYHDKAEVAQSTVGNKIVYENDLVFNKLKAHLGVFFKSTIKGVGIVSPDYAVYHTKGQITDLKYLEVLFRGPLYIKQFICRTTGIVEGLMRLYTSDLFSLEVPLPPKEEQKIILDYLENVNQKIATAINLKEQEIEKLKEYKGSLINSVVTGTVRVVE
jgi:type I restriction enzyme, S subunit